MRQRDVTSGMGSTAEARTGSISIDVHHHFNPTSRDNEGNPWSVQMALDELDRNGIASAIASLGPVNDAGSAARPGRIRDANEWATQVVNDHPGRFGLFAAIPLPDVDFALAEIDYAYDVLGADGIGMSTNDGDVWIADDRNEPVFAALERRKAVVFVHPAPTSRCSALSHEYGGADISPPWIEFPTNTARAILGLLAKGMIRRYPSIKFIFCHGGGVMPALLGRFAGFKAWRTIGPDGLASMFQDGIYGDFSKLYFDCAQAYAPEFMTLLGAVVPRTNLLFGTDFSYFPIHHSVRDFRNLRLDPAMERAVGGGNARALFPRLIGRDLGALPAVADPR